MRLAKDFTTTDTRFYADTDTNGAWYVFDSYYNPHKAVFSALDQASAEREADKKNKEGQCTIIVTFKNTEMGDLSNITELGAQATFFGAGAAIICPADMVDRVDDLLEADDNVDSYVRRAEPA